MGNYCNTNNYNNPAPVLFIPGFTFPVEEYYKKDYEDIVREYQLSNNNNSNNNNYDDDNYDNNNNNIVGYQRKGDIDYDLLIKLILTLSKKINRGNSNSDPMLQPAIGITTATVKITTTL